MRYPAGRREYLRRKHGEPPDDPDDFYLRVDKNVYGREQSGLIWFQMLSQFLTDELGFSVMPVGRCLFRMSREIDGVMKTCVVLTYVDPGGSTAASGGQRPPPEAF